MKWHTQWNHRLCIVVFIVGLGLVGLGLPRPAVADITPVPNGALNGAADMEVSENGQWLAYRVLTVSDTFDLFLLNLADPTLVPRQINTIPLSGHDNFQFSPTTHYLLHEQVTDLYLYDLTTETDRQLTDGVIGDIYEFTPNEQYVVAITQNALWSVPLDGTPPHSLLPEDVPGGWLPTIAISLDSRMVIALYSAMTDTEVGYFISAPITGTGIVVHQELGILFWSDAYFSQNSRYAYVRATVTTDNSGETRLFQWDTVTGINNMFFRAPSISGVLKPSSDRRYLFISWPIPESGTMELFRINTNTGEIVLLFSSDQRIDYQVAPTGNRVVFREYYGFPARPNVL